MESFWSEMIIDGKSISKTLKDKLKEGMPHIKSEYGRVPCLAVVIVGEDPASLSYVRGKIKAAEYVGMASRLIELPETVKEKELLSVIDGLNADEMVDGILVQLPLPPHIAVHRVVESIDRTKDADGFHPDNVSALWLGKKGMIPCTPLGIMKMLEVIGVNPAGKRAVVVGRSNIVGKPVAKLLMDADATVTVAHSKTVDLASVTREADILIVAAGHAGLVTSDMIKPGATVIDVGVNKEDGVIRGDVDFEDAREVAGAITPVPGGVGPMTIAMLLLNTLECFINRFNQ